MYEPPMPRHEVSGVVDGQSLVDMYGNEVIELQKVKIVVRMFHAGQPTRDFAPAAALEGVSGGRR